MRRVRLVGRTIAAALPQCSLGWTLMAVLVLFPCAVLYGTREGRVFGDASLSGDGFLGLARSLDFYFVLLGGVATFLAVRLTIRCIEDFGFKSRVFDETVLNWIASYALAMLSLEYLVWPLFVRMAHPENVQNFEAMSIVGRVVAFTGTACNVVCTGALLGDATTPANSIISRRMRLALRTAVGAMAFLGIAAVLLPRIAPHSLLSVALSTAVTLWLCHRVTSEWFLPGQNETKPDPVVGYVVWGISVIVSGTVGFFQFLWGTEDNPLISLIRQSGIRSEVGAMSLLWLLGYSLGKLPSSSGSFDRAAKLGAVLRSILPRSDRAG